MLGHTDFVKVILSRNPELARELDSQHSLPLHLAAAKGDLETVEALLVVMDDNQFLNARDDYGMTVLPLAVADKQIESQRNENDIDIAEYLRVAGALRTTDTPSSSSTSRVHFNVVHNYKPEDWLVRKREALMVVAR
ncbi:hypothetical protein L484_003774 [Morus notabilis]|uniref:Uncharacterized protein n=1 Tax=Morus notabilis TaxID=981085 RepID=W9QPY6_9ROSA|nr:hypothetical protein L484_003774 [Morus notabilis]